MIDFSKIPDGITHFELERYLYIYLLIYSDNLNKDNKVYAYEQLMELATRPTYELLDSELSNKISDFMIKNMDLRNFEIMDSVLTIVACLKLKKVYSYINENKSFLNDNILKLINEFEEECLKMLDNPYYDYM